MLESNEKEEWKETKECETKEKESSKVLSKELQMRCVKGEQPKKKYRERKIPLDALANHSEPMSGTLMGHYTRKRTILEPVWKYHLMLTSRSQFGLPLRKNNELNV